MRQPLFLRGAPAGARVRWRAAIFCIGISVWIIGCDEQSGRSGESSQRSLRVFIVGESEAEPSWPVLKALAGQFHENSRRVEFIAVAPKSSSPQEQQALLDSLPRRGASVACLIPTDPPSVRASVNRLATGGCRVVTIARDVPESGRSVYCGPSETEIGRKAAEACAVALSGRPQTVMTLTSTESNTAYRVRSHSFREEIPLYGPIEIVKEVECGGNIFDAVEIVRRDARSYPRIGCWVLFDDWPLRATSAKERLLPLGCRMVLCNGNPKYMDRVSSGEIQAIVTFDFYECVFNALQAASGLAEEPTRQRPAFVMVDSVTVTISEMEWYRRCWESWRHGQPSPPQSPWE
ncbi:MAG: substrate-binding domain-containing protein [Phycisphaerae bacterium]|nr:substrate-binding domain-containing protein [Phycisphaerae bacterium]